MRQVLRPSSGGILEWQQVFSNPKVGPGDAEGFVGGCSFKKQRHSLQLRKDQQEWSGVGGGPGLPFLA